MLNPWNKEMKLCMLYLSELCLLEVTEKEDAHRSSKSFLDSTRGVSLWGQYLQVWLSANHFIPTVRYKKCNPALTKLKRLTAQNSFCMKKLLRERKRNKRCVHMCMQLHGRGKVVHGMRQAHPLLFLACNVYWSFSVFYNHTRQKLEESH